MRLVEYRSRMRRYNLIMIFVAVLIAVSIGLAIICYREEIYVGMWMALFYVLCGVAVGVFEKRPRV